MWLTVACTSLLLVSIGPVSATLPHPVPTCTAPKLPNVQKAITFQEIAKLSRVLESDFRAKGWCFRLVEERIYGALQHSDSLTECDDIYHAFFNGLDKDGVKAQKYAGYVKDEFRTAFDGCDNSTCVIQNFCRKIVDYVPCGKAPRLAQDLYYTVRIATKSIRKELHRAVDDSVHSAAAKDARKQLLDKVLACSMRMVGLHDEVHKLGNEIRDRNVVVRDLQAKIDWNQGRINDEERMKRHNIDVRDRLTRELTEAEQLGRIKDKQITETNEALAVQRGKNEKLHSIVAAAEKGNLAIRSTLENCRTQLSEALN